MASIIHTENLVKEYLIGKEKIFALHGVSLDIEANEYVALVGPSGSGKSTLMNILGALDTPSSGKYILNGNDVNTLKNNELAEIRNKNIGFVFQTFNLIPRMSALENVALPLVYAGISKSERIRRAGEKLEQVGLGERSNHKPNEMSGGQRQRVAIARALINDPAILLADEPTGNLDSKTTGEIMDLFEMLHNDGNTIIIVTHEPDIASRTKRIVKLRDGIVEEDIINTPNNAKIEGLH